MFSNLESKDCSIPVTLETGAAGNTYAEAVRLVPPLARALEQILIKFS